MPVATTYKGVGIHAGQPAKRVAQVKREIDKIGKISDLIKLFEIAGDCAWAPEARLFAGARCIAGLELATERREPKPDIDREDVEACMAGLASIGWADPFQYCCMLDARPEQAAKRERLAALARLAIAAVQRLPVEAFRSRGRGYARAASAASARDQLESIAFGSAVAYFLIKADSN